MHVAVLPDHPTPCRLRTHTSAPVPFLIYRPGDTPDDVTVFSEESAADGGYGLLTGSQFIKSLIK